MTRLDGRLRNAANNGEIDTVRRLLAEGASPDAPNADGMTGLQLATRNGHLDVVAELIAAGADPFRRERGLQSSLAIASSSGDAETVLALLRSEREPVVGDLENAVGWAVAFASPETIEILVEHGADVRAVDPATGRTALDHAQWWCEQAHPDNRPKFERVLATLRAFASGAG
ncbi:MAG: ankyrin repeat domain-containing protein [Acidobacteria bacterium]|nr:MAG: ankyrin repeat domain-containing protein [Acidobacteriota bacterium]REK06320.1 MAG: ankyrin repeat domain-containing protein [Acidobacteriota bacterium]